MPMSAVRASVLGLLWQDPDEREEALRDVVAERLAANATPRVDDHVVATYFFALRSLTLTKLADEIAYHATSGTHDPPPGSLLEACTGKAVGVDAFDATGRIGLLHMAYPLKMMRHPDGHVTSSDLLHTTVGAIVCDVYENRDARLIALELPDDVLKTFPGPAYGPEGVRKATGFAPDQPAFGTILKPTAGITPDEVGELVGEAAQCPLFLFVKEDENLYPDLDYSPVAERTRRAVASIERARDARGGVDILFAPHVSGGPHEMMDTLHEVLDAGATAVMFSETFAGGAVRMVREATKGLERPPAIYGHNAGIGIKTRVVWREVVDLLARLDGIDFRQTAPVRSGTPFLRPYGAEWRASESALRKPIPGIRPTMIVRAGGLDQGNICMNVADAEARGIFEGVLFLAGSAINSIKNARGDADPTVGARAMMQAFDLYRSGQLRDIPNDDHVREIARIAEAEGLSELRAALTQRYPGEAA